MRLHAKALSFAALILGVTLAWSVVPAHAADTDSDDDVIVDTTPATTAANPNLGAGTVKAAYAALQGQPGMVQSNRNGWTIVHDNANGNVWSFVPPGHPAYPAAVRQHVVRDAYGVQICVSLICDSSESACNALYRKYQAQDDQTAEQMASR